MSTTDVKVGDRVIYSPGWRFMAPCQDKVKRVTPKGFIEIESKPGVLFRPRRNWWKEQGTGSEAIVYPFTEEKWQDIHGKHLAREQAKQEEQDRRAADQARKEAERVQELVQIKELLGDWRCVHVHYKVMFDGSRLILCYLPVREKAVERKGQEEAVLIRLVSEEETDIRASLNQVIPVKRPVVRAAMTTVSANGASHSLPSYSVGDYSSDDEAIWDCLRRAYFGW